MRAIHLNAMSKYKIETGVPQPTWEEISKYPFIELNVGDSFLVPIADASPSSVNTSRTRFCSRNKGWKLRVLKVKEGTRVWCVSKPTP